MKGRWQEDDVDQYQDIIQRIRRLELAFDPLVTTFPTDPNDGQSVMFQPTAAAAQGIGWRMRYKSSSASAYKWEAAPGGGYIWDTVVTDQQRPAGAAVWGDLATVGPQLTLPATGEYFFQASFNGYQAGSITINPSAMLFLNGAQVANTLGQVVSVSGQAGTAGWFGWFTGTVGHVVKMVYLQNTQTTNFRERRLAIRPLRLSTT